MSRLSGIQNVLVDLEARILNVTFDPALTDAEAIRQALIEVGYESFDE